MNKTAKIELRVTPAERHILEGAAAENGNTLSNYVRRAALDQAQARPFFRPDEIEALDQVREQIRRAGVNLNILLRDMAAYESGRHKDAPDFTELPSIKTDFKAATTRLRQLLQMDA
ncbi:plasmid mobilization protein [Fodinicurvata fenggangensis]|uniref:plasmid mobilization protein n=1 Tax=Fodinicurvata fenggangensis TaxID=1121830 RepID=UPI00138E2A64|nr:DUF1778 domain-containing protein [Fodinicurvata fenggangensis]